MVATRFEARGGQALRARLESMSARLEATSWADGMHALLLARMRTRFETQGRSEDRAWPELARQEPMWAALKRRVGADPRPLRWRPGARERLYPSLTDARDSAHRYEVLADEVRMSSTLPYAADVDRGGGKNPFGEPIPARPLAHLGRTTRAVMARTLKRHVLEPKGLPERAWESADER